MAKGKRKVPDINSSSTADIAFLLLIFFLITTSMDTDRGLARRLPPPPEQNQKNDDIKLKERNVLQVFLNMNDQLMCGNDYITTDQLRAKAKEFIANPYNDETKPEKHAKDIPFFGNMMITEKNVFLCVATVVLLIRHILLYKTSWLQHTMSYVMSWLRKNGKRTMLI